ncbi:MAG TPA: hypothetical protein VNA89_13180 [Gemmatimonadaceae bacterium]|nr:hypothetical protein [Gemmatimonadaceae bacterium]
MKRKTPQAIYQAEKERARRERRTPHARLMAEARREYERLLAQNEAARKGGRPKKSKSRDSDDAK